MEPVLHGVLVGRRCRSSCRSDVHGEKRAPRSHLGDALGGGGGRSRPGVRLCRPATGTRWGYALAPVDGGTELTESWEFPATAIAGFQERFGEDADNQIEQRRDLARTGIAATLAAIKQDAEGSSA
ncbi:MAG TPA: hypothetical protein VKU86_07460 [Acidimicrobiales bacterium]|nr:hypothetical protein [Acidimicrobiales bacterium]